MFSGVKNKYRIRNSQIDKLFTIICKGFFEMLKISNHFYRLNDKKCFKTFYILYILIS